MNGLQLPDRHALHRLEHARLAPKHLPAPLDKWIADASRPLAPEVPILRLELADALLELAESARELQRRAVLGAQSGQERLDDVWVRARERSLHLRDAVAVHAEPPGKVFSFAAEETATGANYLVSSDRDSAPRKMIEARPHSLLQECRMRPLVSLCALRVSAHSLSRRHGCAVAVDDLYRFDCVAQAALESAAQLSRVLCIVVEVVRQRRELEADAPQHA